MSTPTTATEIRLASRPVGRPALDNFSVVDTEIPTPGAGRILVRNLVLSLDPYMRGRMSEAKSYVAPYEVGRVMTGGAVGEVIESRSESFEPGDLVLHQLGWRSHAAVPAEHAVKVDPEAAPPSAYLGVLGMPGLTAYAGLLRAAEFKAGDVVFVSAAAGAVGSVVGQLAELKGAKRVVGSAGSAAKVAHLLDDLGFDAAFNYKDGPVAGQLAAAAPEGIDVYFDNVGGEHLEAAIGAANLHGRIAICGMISQYNATEPPPGPHNMIRVLLQRLTIRGFLVGEHEDLRQQFFAELAPLVREGKLRYDETVVEGLANAPQGFLDLLSGGNTGKMLVRV